MSLFKSWVNPGVTEKQKKIMNCIDLIVCFSSYLMQIITYGKHIIIIRKQSDFHVPFLSQK